MAKTGRHSFQQMLRLTEELREQLLAASEASGRSMNAEIVSRLEQSFAAFPAGSAAADPATQVEQARHALRQALAALEFEAVPVDDEA